MKKESKIAAIVLTFLLVCSCAFSIQKLPELYKQNISAVVYTSGNVQHPFFGTWHDTYGSGFVINKRDGLIITAAHLIEDVNDFGVEFCLGFEKKIPIVVEDIDYDNDIALVRTTMDLSTLNFMPELQLNTNPSVGEKIFSIGNPADFQLTVSSGILSSNFVYPVDFWKSFPRGIYLGDYHTNGGASGSAVFDLNGEVIGMNVGYCGNMAVIVPALSIDTFLKENGYTD